jgi:large subunit ribosomal protein L9
MNVILLKDLDKVGDKYEIVNVKAGYGRNFLIPQKIAVIANTVNLKKLDEIKDKEASEIAARLSEFQEIADQLKGKTIKIGAKSGTSGKIFGSITSVQISNALSEQLNLDVERRKISLPDDIKVLGTYTAVLNLHPDVDSKIDFEVVSE